MKNTNTNALFNKGCNGDLNTKLKTIRNHEQVIRSNLIY